MQTNAYGQAIGHSLRDFQAGELPQVQLLQGQYCRLEKIGTAHTEDLWAVYNDKTPAQNWTYLPPKYGPFADKNDFSAFMQEMMQSQDPYHFAIIDQADGKALGTFSLMRIDRANRSVEVGAVIYGEALKRSRIAGEAQFLLAQYVFEQLRYRRYEWKCDSLNDPSRRAALRLGFQFEGIFRQHLVYHGRNRDTAWFSMLDSEWAANKARFQRWLVADNFDVQGRQKTPL